MIHFAGPVSDGLSEGQTKGIMIMFFVFLVIIWLIVFFVGRYVFKKIRKR